MGSTEIVPYVPFSLTANRNISLSKDTRSVDLETIFFRCPVIVHYEDDRGSKHWVEFRFNEIINSIWEKSPVINDFDSTISVMFEKKYKAKPLKEACEELTKDEKIKMKKLIVKSLNNTAIVAVQQSYTPAQLYRSSINLAATAHLFGMCLTKDKKTARLELERVLKASKIINKTESYPCMVGACKLKSRKFKAEAIGWNKLIAMILVGAFVVTARIKVCGYTTILEKLSKTGRKFKLFRPLINGSTEVSARLLRKVTSNKKSESFKTVSKTAMTLEKEEAEEEEFIGRILNEKGKDKRKLLAMVCVVSLISYWIIQRNPPEKIQEKACDFIETVLNLV
jgi:hypothetical protein